MRDGAVPDRWRKARLGEVVVRIEGGGTPSRDIEAYWGGDIAWASVKDMRSSTIVRTQETITREGLANSSSRLVPAGSTLLATRMAVGAVATTTIPVAINQDLKALVPGDDLDAAYLPILLRLLTSEILSASTGTTVSGIRLESIRDLIVLVPPLDEQRTIAEILSAVDEAIERTEAVIERVQEVKRALAQELLTRGMPGKHARFKQSEVGEIPEDWEVVRLGDLIATGPTNGLYKHHSSYGAGVSIVRVDDFYDGEFARTSGFKRVQVEREEASPYILRAGEILINRVNSMSHLGKCALVPALAEPTVFESNMMCFGIDGQRTLADFTILWLCSPQAIQQIHARAKKAVAQASISQGDIRGLVLALPPVDEQNAIMHAILSVDRRIKGESGALAELTHSRDQLAHALLTGHLRVVAEKRT